MNITAQLEALSAYPVEEPEPEFKSEIEYFDWLWKNQSLPHRLRFAAAAEVAKYRNPRMAVTSHVSRKDMASVLEKARDRANGARVLQLVPKAIEQHPAQELGPQPTFRRRF
jgi:hypothetical protein